MQELVLDGPGKNALSTAMLTDLMERMDRFEGQSLLLRGENGALSAGVNLKEVLAFDHQQMEDFLRLLDAITRRLFHWPRPTVAVIDGHAIAGGTILALACDHRVAQDNPKIRIGLSEVAVGVLFPPGVWDLMKHKLPKQHIDRILLGAQLHGPQQAQALGMVDEISADALASGRATLERLRAYDAAVYAETKATLHAGVMEISEADEQTYLDAVVPVWTSPALKARLAAQLGGKR
ncbi:MAG: enoyl-CoA hydratase/isomerase family protein [Myxococcota bacterium]|nr:enoyl-CoA hydratase/isomerase family protein [Myxococcota bacterium]